MLPSQSIIDKIFLGSMPLDPSSLSTPHILACSPLVQKLMVCGRHMPKNPHALHRPKKYNFHQRKFVGNTTDFFQCAGNLALYILWHFLNQKFQFSPIVFSVNLLYCFNLIYIVLCSRLGKKKLRRNCFFTVS